MSVKLDWQIESERAYQRAGEDPEAQRKRRRQRLTILLFTLCVLGALAALGGAVWLRLYTVDTKLRQDLINTVHAETAALRIGDLPAFLSIMRSQSTTWMSEQSARFKRYQDLKQQSSVKLDDNVLDAAVDGSRGRALVQETIDGKNYRVVWFFWHYTDGWRHVPADTTFWGDAHQINGQVSTVNYDDLDAPLAEAIASRVDRWWLEGCATLSCSDLPHLTVAIVPEPFPQPQWDEKNPLMLRIASPLAASERAPADSPLSPDLEEAIAARLADKLFDHASGQLPVNTNSDAAWLRQSIIDWLTAIMIGRGDMAQLGFIQSLQDHYGQPAIVALLRKLSTNSNIGVVSTALNQPLDALNLDWRPFFQWRLGLEKSLIQTGNQQQFMAELWDSASPDSAARARQRWAAPGQKIAQVQAVAIAKDASGAAIASVQVQLDGKNMVFSFRLIDGAWKRFA